MVWNLKINLAYIVSWYSSLKYRLGKILIIAITLFCHGAYAQSNIQEAHYKFGETALGQFLNKKCGEAVRKNNIQVCLISVTFAKFTIDSLGNIKTISFSEDRGTPKVFRDILTSIIYATNGSWFPRKINGKAVVSKPFILPIVYEMEAGCYRNKITVNNGTSTAVIGLLDFEDGSGNGVNQLDCIFLRPLYISSQT